MPSTIIAATVLFTGLICHFETNSSTHAKNAILVDAPGHTATLTINSGFSSDSGNWTKTASGAYDLTNEQLTINGGSGNVTVSPEFDLRVPHLKEIIATPDDIHPDIVLGKQHNSIAMVAYAHGDLGIAGCFTDNEIKFKPPVAGKDPRCLAKVIALDFMAGSNWRIEEVGNPAKYIELKASASILIANSPTSNGAHYKYFSKLLKNNTPINDMQHTPNQCTSACVAFPKTVVAHRKNKGRAQAHSSKHFATVECSDSQFP